MSEKHKKKDTNWFGFFVTFVLAFIIIYTALGFIPAWRIKLEADVWNYLVHSWQHMIPVKAAISAVASLILGWLFTH